MKARQKRLIFVLLGVVAVIGASFLISKAMQGNFYKLYTPQEVLAGEVPTGQVIRIGGLVKEGSLKRSDTKLEARFIVLDKHKNEITVITNKILPDLFKEGKSQIARGILKDDGIFYAEEVLAKHDANYMPEEVKDLIEKEHTPIKDGAK
ncbi:MAG TPA: cytochrome c maturation protein CcmE [Leucothrix mucor]|uniref:Cytochrome c-type biogenesis protein CcmE n=1 Tax=Leucothrix mucor TaxID=45248 RepID=A0A7V2WUN2_LEUMU|nr:cytochrome c maturation protein CcmE [Leucothrix mucor]